MRQNLSPIDMAKYAAATRAAEFVENGMKVGLGTGSTAAWLIRRLGERVRDEGLKITGVPTSRRTAELAEVEGIKTETLEAARWLDLTIDGADEYDGELNLIKGGGGALLHEKIVATASDQMVVIADLSKRVEQLGAFAVPVEVIELGWTATKALLEEAMAALNLLGSEVTQRMAGTAPFRTDEGNFILDLHCKAIEDARQLAIILNQIPGVVENGLFIDICDVVVTGHGNGRVEVFDLNSGHVEDAHVSLAPSDNIFSDLAD